MKNTYRVLIILVCITPYAFASNWIKVSTYEGNDKVNPTVNISVKDSIDTIIWRGPEDSDTSYVYIYTYKIKAGILEREHDYWYVSYFDTVNKVYRTEKVDSGPSDYTQSITEIVYGLTDTIVSKQNIIIRGGKWNTVIRKVWGTNGPTDPWDNFYKTHWIYNLGSGYDQMLDTIYDIYPKDSLTITFTSRGLPAISQMHFVGTSRGDDPIKVYDGYEDYQLPDELFEKSPFGGKPVYTVLPWKQPGYDTLGRLTLTEGQSMIDSLRSWIDKSVHLGWLDERLSGRLKRKLDPVEKYMWEGRGENHARHSLLAFMSILERNRGRGVNNEAYFVLYYNARYLLSYLPRGGPQ